MLSIKHIVLSAVLASNVLLGYATPVAVTTIMVLPLPASTAGASTKKTGCGRAPTVTYTSSEIVTLTVYPSTVSQVNNRKTHNGSHTVGPTGTGHAHGTGYRHGHGHKHSTLHSLWTAPTDTTTWKSTTSTTSISVSSTAAAVEASSSGTTTTIPPPPPPPPTTLITQTTMKVPSVTTTAVVLSTIASTASAAPTPSPSTVKNTSGGGSLGVKRGLVYTNDSPAPLLNNANIGWAYNYGPTNDGEAKGLKFVPMLWGNTENYTPTWVSDANAAIAAGDDSIMAFNEPDQPNDVGGSAISPSDAAASYKQYMAPFNGKILLGAPAVSNGNQSNPAMGVQWLQPFFEACTGCPFDFIPLHWYGWSGASAQEQATVFMQYIETAASEIVSYGGPSRVWVTEFAALPLEDDATNAAFLDIVLPWLDQSPIVDRYSFFGVFPNYLLDSAGNGLSTSGNVYAA
ncbi:MAG: hypothetical protein MMC33_001358 [Icmadophila ericetorum]|nr:hypothetical protein [Icmadophila ericetorum]